MKKLPFVIMLFVSALFTGCNKDEAPAAKINEIIVNSKEYVLTAANGSGISGKATFTKDSNNNTTILIQLNNTTTAEHPAYLRFNSAAQGGIVAITLTVCTCATGTTVVTKLDNGDPINFDGLIQLNGHISIHGDGTNIETIVATADIGANGN